MAIAPDRLRFFVWQSPILCSFWAGLKAFSHARDGSYWDAAAMAVFGVVLASVVLFQRPGRLKTSHVVVSLVVLSAGFVAWLAGTDPILRATGFVIAMVTFVTMNLLPRTGPALPFPVDDDQPIVLDLSR